MTNFEYFKWLVKDKDIETFSKILSSSFDCSCCILKDQCDPKYKCESNIVKWLNMDTIDKSKITFDENEVDKLQLAPNPSDEEMEDALNNYYEAVDPSEEFRQSLYIFPAIFKEDFFDDNKTIYVSFPDLENCFSDGINLQDAILNAKEALGNVLYWMERDGNKIPTPSDIRDISINEENEIKTLIYVDMAKVIDEWKNKKV